MSEECRERRKKKTNLLIDIRVGSCRNIHFFPVEEEEEDEDSQRGETERGEGRQGNKRVLE